MCKWRDGLVMGEGAHREGQLGKLAVEKQLGLNQHACRWRHSLMQVGKIGPRGAVKDLCK